jgi:hypothetical protein
MQNNYETDVDFFSLFEADTFSKEEYADGMFKGYVQDSTGELVLAGTVLAGTFAYEDAQAYEGAGVGWWNDALI